MRARDLTKGSIAYHDTLNQDVWKGRELRIDVRYKLLEIAKRFVEYLDVPDFKLVDVILRGSLVNYNYTQYSDFDLHIVTDYTVLDCDITESFYMAKKKIWNDEHDITIKGHEVELYVEDRNEKNVSAGTYSVLDARWLRTPKYQQPDIDDRAVSAKARDIMTQINRAVKQGSIEDITRLQDKIRSMRQAGLDAGGEFSTENLAFKIIRNKKFLDKLYKTKNSKVDQELSLDERRKSKKKKRKTKARRYGYPGMGYYGYYYGGNQDQSDSGGDAGGGGDGGGGGGGESIRESQARLDPEVEDFLEGLTPDDVGRDEVGDYIVHYEGFTDQCQDSDEYRDDPEAVFNDVWGDFKRRMGDKDPINYGIVGSEEYPIVYSVFRKSELEEGWKQNLAAAGLGTALALGGTGAQANPDPDSPTWDQVGTTMNLQAKSSEQWNDDTPVKDQYSEIQGPDRDGDYRIAIWNGDKLLKQLVTKNPQAAVNLLKQKYPWMITKVRR